ncbi:MAG TPA: TrmH family RNA methyltransferase, partial [Lachnospiraceae bacterium]|nr:TrmH family RNA methyltransferase [Lachnospiraceae bacterium]
FKKEYVNKVYVHSLMKQGDTMDKLAGICRDAGIPVIYTDKIFNVLSQKENCYVIGEFRKFESGLNDDRSHIVLVNPSDAGNMGTILRSALGFGLDQIAVIREAADIFNPKVVRASMGAVFSSEYEYFDSFNEYLVKYSNRELYPFMLNARTSLHDLKPGRKFSLIFGNEAR